MHLLALQGLWLAPALFLGEHGLSPSLTQPRAAAPLGQGLLGTAPMCQGSLFHPQRYQSLRAGPHTTPSSAQLKGPRAATSNTEGLKHPGWDQLEAEDCGEQLSLCGDWLAALWSPWAGHGHRPAETSVGSPCPQGCPQSHDVTPSSDSWCAVLGPASGPVPSAVPKIMGWASPQGSHQSCGVIPVPSPAGWPSPTLWCTQREPLQSLGFRAAPCVPPRQEGHPQCHTGPPRAAGPGLAPHCPAECPDSRLGHNSRGCFTVPGLGFFPFPPFFF